MVDHKKLTRELRRQLQALEPVPEQGRPEKVRPTLSRRQIIVAWSVRRPDGGLPFRFEYKASASVWREEAEHRAKLEIKRAGLIPHVHLETIEAEA